VIGRTPDTTIQLASNAVSRRHAQLVRKGETWTVEDLGSANGTFHNGRRLQGGQSLADGDEVRICEFVLLFRAGPDEERPAPQILERVQAEPTNAALFAENPQQKLQTLLLLAQSLGQTSAVTPLLDKLLEHLLQLFPLADRGLAVMCEGSKLIVRAQRTRRQGDADFSFSRTVLRQALDSGAALLSEDVQRRRFAASSTLSDVEAASLMCVPLLGHDGSRLGAVQLDCTGSGEAFTGEHLRLLTTVCLLAAVALENVALQAVRLREEGLRRELAMGREIQLGFLPTEFAAPPGAGWELHADLQPAKEVSGDLYDFFPLADGRLAFLVGDVSDKGIPAAMFMVKAQTMVRHLAPLSAGPADTLARLNAALTVNNPSSMFLTLAHGIFDSQTGEVVLASCGHPRPLLRKPDGSADEVAMPVGRLLGCFDADPGAADVRFVLRPGQTLVLFSDGYTEAAAPGTRKMLGLEPLKEWLGGPRATLPLAACAEYVAREVRRFIGGGELQDDLTILLLRRT
jgi:serine phosphatase RsbU (regulator of sigma subunit)